LSGWLIRAWGDEMRDRDLDAAWGELGQIDFLLNELARAVDRGDIPRGSYDAMAPRYLARRAEIIELVSEVTCEEAYAQRPEAPAVSWAAPAEEMPRAQAPVVGTIPGADAPIGFEPEPRRESRPVPWTTILTFVGAFLVVAAAAIFTAATWETMSVPVRLGFLGTLTIGFYAAGLIVLRRFELQAGAIALTVVGSAMLLFDGWIIIDGYNLPGAWPWVGWLALCTVVYWVMEYLITGGYLGVIGAAAQVAWWWMLGSALGWSDSWRFAGLAVVALLWAITGRWGRERSAVRSLARILEWAAPGLAFVCVAGLLLVAATAEDGWAAIAPAAVLAAALVGVGILSRELAESFGSGRMTQHPYPYTLVLGAFGQLPLGIAIVVSVSPAVTWGQIGLLVALGFVYALVEARFGGYVFGVFAILAEAGAWIAISMRYEWRIETQLAVLGVVALVWQVSAFLARESEAAGDGWPGIGSLREVTEIAGWAQLALVTLALAVSGPVPLTGLTTHAAQAASASVLLLCWGVASIVRRDPVQAVCTFAWSLWTAAALMAWAEPNLHSAWYATGLLVVAALWLHGRSVVERASGLDRAAVAWLSRAVALLVLVLGLTIAEGWSELNAWQTVVLLGASVLFWAADAVHDGPLLSWGLAAGLLPLAARTSGVFWAGANEGALAAAGAGLVVVASAAALASRARSAATAAVIGACVMSSLLVFGASDTWVLAVGLAIVAASWAVAMLPSDTPEFAGIAALFAIGAAVAGIAAIEPAPAPWVLVVTVCVMSGAFLVPAWVTRPDQGPMFRAGRALTLAGLAGAAGLVLVGLASASLGEPLSSWADIGEQGLAIALFALGAFVIIASFRFGIEAGLYVGAWLLLMGLWVELHTLDQTRLEYYSTTLAAWLIAMGYLYKSRGVGREAPRVTDLSGTIIGLGVPVLLSLGSGGLTPAWEYSMWTVVLALIAIGGGVFLRVRTYFFGGVAALVLTAILRSLAYLAEYWFITLGIIGVAMLVVALTWERRRAVLAGAGHRVRDTFTGWR
jgi:hypothetical protein